MSPAERRAAAPIPVLRLSDPHGIVSTMKPLEIAPRGSVLFALLYNSCSNPSETEGVNIYDIDLHCDNMQVFAKFVYDGKGNDAFEVYSMNRVLSSGDKQSMSHTAFYEAVAPMSDPYGKVSL